VQASNRAQNISLLMTKKINLSGIQNVCTVSFESHITCCDLYSSFYLALPCCCTELKPNELFIIGYATSTLTVQNSNSCSLIPYTPLLPSLPQPLHPALALALTLARLSDQQTLAENQPDCSMSMSGRVLDNDEAASYKRLRSNAPAGDT
jgi:hypothetical protein